MFDFKVFSYFMTDLCGLGGDLENFYNSIVEEQEHFQSLGYPSNNALTGAFNHKLDEFDDLRLHMFMSYIWGKDMYDTCHKVCDEYFQVDALWYPIEVIKYDSSGFIFKDRNTNRLAVGELNETTMLDYTIVPFYNYDEFYPVM